MHSLGLQDNKNYASGLVMLRVDHGNALLCGVLETLLHKLQMVQNSAAWLIAGARRRDHTTPVLSSLHWLPFPQRFEFNILLLGYRAVHHLRPEYLTFLLTPCSPTHSLISAGQRHLTIPRYHLERFGWRSFAVAGQSDSLHVFLATLMICFKVCLSS